MQKFTADGKLLSVIPVLPNPGGMAITNSGDLFRSFRSIRHGRIAPLGSREKDNPPVVVCKKRGCWERVSANRRET